MGRGAAAWVVRAFWILGMAVSAGSASMSQTMEASQRRRMGASLRLRSTMVRPGRRLRKDSSSFRRMAEM